jgi:hypothetical protein
MTFLLNFIKIYWLVKNYLGRNTDRPTEKHNGDLISFTFIFKEIRLAPQPGRDADHSRPFSAEVENE